MAKNIGIVKWFGDWGKDFGFITFLVGKEKIDGDLFFHRSAVTSFEPLKGDLVSFNVVTSKKGFKAVKVNVVNEPQALVNEIDFANEADYQKIREVVRGKGKKFFYEFIDAIPKENFRKYSWLRAELSLQKHIALCLKIYSETPTTELEDELADLIVGTEIKFSFPPELAVKKIFRDHSNAESIFASAEKYFDELSVDELAGLMKNFSPAEILRAAEGKTTFDEKFPALVKIFFEQSSAVNEWVPIILAQDLPHEIIFSRVAELNPDNKFFAAEKYFDELSVDELAGLLKNFSPAEILRAAEGKTTFDEKFPALVKIFFEQSSAVNEWASIILAQDLPHEIIFSRIEELNPDNKFFAAEKYFDELSVDELAGLLKNFSPAEILRAAEGKATFDEKFPALVKKIFEQSFAVNEWVPIILAQDLPHEIIFSRVEELNSENKFFAAEKYFDELSVDKLAGLMKNFSPAEILRAAEGKTTFNEKISAIIESNTHKFDWAQYFVDNPELFLQTKVGDDVLIFFMYETVRRWNGQPENLSALKNFLSEKISDLTSAPRAKIIYDYICAAADAENRDKFMDDADKIFTEIFNETTEKISAQTENSDEEISIIPKHDAHILPPCTAIEHCRFCEAVTWNKKVEDDIDGTFHWETVSWCRRRNLSQTPCSRLFPNLYRSAEDWSVIELMEKLHLTPYANLPAEHKNNREFFTRLGGEFNRLNKLRERVKCRKCGKFMRADIHKAKWMMVRNIKSLQWVEHFPVLIATFRCQTVGCPECGKPVYISYCWNCGETIDSRDLSVKIAGKGSGYYLCGKCGAGYKDLPGPQDMFAIFPGKICPSCTRCPRCGEQNFKAVEGADGKFKLRCEKCGEVMKAPLTIASHGSKYKKGECSVCGHKLEWNSERTENFAKLQPIPWA